MNIVDPAIESYLRQLQPSHDPLLIEMEARAARDRFPIIGPLVGRLCMQTALALGARDIFEMGSGFGYSTWWFAQAIADGGRVVHTDGNPERSAEARAYLERAGLGGRVIYEVGSAVSILEKYPGPFDIVFIDINKHEYPRALELARSRVREGGFIITDNVLWSGKVTRPDDSDDDTRGVLRYNLEAMSARDLMTTVIPLRDGVALSLKIRSPAPRL